MAQYASVHDKPAVRGSIIANLSRTMIILSCYPYGATMLYTSTATSIRGDEA